MTEIQIEPTKGQRMAGNIAAGAYVVLCGVFLLLVGLGVFEGLTIGNVTLIAIFYTLALAFITGAFIQKNTASLWIGTAFAVPATVTLLNNFPALTYAQLYPIYIAIPAICCAVTMILSRAYADHLKVILFFGAIALIFALQSSGLVGWGVVAPLLIVFIGLMVIIVAVRGRKNGDEDNE